MLAINVVYLLSLMELAIGGGRVNVALRKKTTMSSNHTGTLTSDGAVDGRVNTIIPDVIHTAEHRQKAWWMVNLGVEVFAHTVQIFFRTDYTYRRNGISIFTIVFRTLHLCHRVTGRSDGSDIRDVVSVKCRYQWRFVVISTETDNDGNGAVLDFGEVKIIGCLAGWFGSTCKQRCRSCSVCDADTGRCQLEYHLTEACNHPYGSLCKTCHCFFDLPCDVFTGSCPFGCQGGWSGADCQTRIMSAYENPIQEEAGDAPGPPYDNNILKTNANSETYDKTVNNIYMSWTMFLIIIIMVCVLIGGGISTAGIWYLRQNDPRRRGQVRDDIALQDLRRKEAAEKQNQKPRDPPAGVA